MSGYQFDWDPATMPYTPYVPGTGHTRTSPAAPAPAAPAPAAGATAAQRAIFDQVRAVLSGAGLDALFGVDGNGNPTGWVWEQIVADKGAAAILLDMEQTAPFQQKFGIITQLRSAAATNPAVHIPTPAEVLAYRTTVASTMRAAGLPAWFYDEQSDFDSLMLKGQSPAEIEDKLGEAWTRMQKADPAMKAAFAEFYGPTDGDPAMVAFFLDPQHTTTKLNVATRAAYTAGKGSTLGITITKDAAEAIAKMDLSDAAIQSGLGQVSGLSPLYKASLGESGDPSISSDTGIEAVFGGSGEAAGAISRRRTGREAVNKTTGGALTTGAGVLGVGS